MSLDLHPYENAGDRLQSLSSRIRLRRLEDVYGLRSRMEAASA